MLYVLTAYIFIGLCVFATTYVCERFTNGRIVDQMYKSDLPAEKRKELEDASAGLGERGFYAVEWIVAACIFVDAVFLWPLIPLEVVWKNFKKAQLGKQKNG
jgi:hypothetical protein